MTISALLVEDDPQMRAILRIALRAHGRFSIAGEAATGAEASRLAADVRPDVVVLDLGLPDLDPRHVLSQVRRASPTSRIVIFSGMDAERDWFEARTDGYVGKADELDQLVDLVERVATGGHREAVVELTYDPIAPAEARGVVRDVLVHWGYRDLLDDAALVVSELVTNAVRHAGSASLMVVNRLEGGIRIEVRDDGPGSPVPEPPESHAERGRGLMIVSALATAWGVESGESSKTVWVELAERTTAGSDSPGDD
jgi:DNA-binding response OmpR family regulator